MKTLKDRSIVKAVFRTDFELEKFDYRNEKINKVELEQQEIVNELVCEMDDVMESVVNEVLGRKWKHEDLDQFKILYHPSGSFIEL